MLEKAWTTSENCDFELKNGSGFWGRGFIAGERFEPTTYQIFVSGSAGLVSQVQAAEQKVKVFILAGQSNMEGHGQIRSLDWLGQHPKYGHLLKKLKNADGSWAVRKDVTIAWTTKAGKSV